MTGSIKTNQVSNWPCSAQRGTNCRPGLYYSFRFPGEGPFRLEGDLEIQISRHAMNWIFVWCMGCSDLFGIYHNILIYQENSGDTMIRIWSQYDHNMITYLIILDTLHGLLSEGLSPGRNKSADRPFLMPVTSWAWRALVALGTGPERCKSCWL